MTGEIDGGLGEGALLLFEDDVLFKVNGVGHTWRGWN
jgi:hypothetical protein